MHIPSPRSKKRARIEIIPLIDIMFFLLATFVVVSLSMVKNQGISVDLPKASTGAKLDREKTLSISIDRAGNYFLNKNAITVEALEEKLSEAKTRDSELKIFINGDRDARFASVVAVLDLTRRLGITKVAIETTTVESAR